VGAAGIVIPALAFCGLSMSNSAPPKLYYRLIGDRIEAPAPVSKVTKRHIRTLHNVTFECDKTSHSTIRNNKDYYRDNNKDCIAASDCAEGAEAVETAPTHGEAPPCDAVVDESLVELHSAGMANLG